MTGVQTCALPISKSRPRQILTGRRSVVLAETRVDESGQGIDDFGRVLDQALHDAGIAREEAFVTNAVKHFKHEMRGKRRLHKRPDNYEIERCRIWLDAERSLVKPSTIVALGVTAARSLTGRTVTIGKVRGKPFDMEDGTKLVVTVHPSALLRIEDEEERHAAHRSLVADLKVAAAANSHGAAISRPRRNAS